MSASDELLERILSDEPSPESLLLILREKKAEGRHELVVRECLKALARFPLDVRIRGLLAESCHESGQLSRAETELESATAQIEALIPIYKLKGKVCAALNRRDEAIRSLGIFLSHAPDDQEARSLLESLRGPSAKPAPEKRSLNVEPLQEAGSFSMPEIATPTLAELYFAQGQIDEAISTYEKILARDPGAEAARKRLEELKAAFSPAEPGPDSAAESERARKKKEKMIHVLESWREKLKKPEVRDQRSEIS